MADNERYFVEWKEHFVSKEKANRVVHYFLKDNLGESILAVVGNERSVRHMFYIVSDEFLSVHGAQNSVHAGFRWRSRREVVDWLTSMLSKQHMQGDYAFSPNGGRSFDVRSHMPSQKSRLARNLKAHHLGIKWSGTPWACGKQLKHYPAFSRNGISIAVRSFVFVMAEKDNRYIAYLEDMYEDRKLQKKVKVRWFHHNREVKGVASLRNLHPKEVFITPYVQVISAECVDGPAIVLTREHYEKCLAVFPNDMLGRVHFCCRQLKSNRPKPFKLTKLRGYCDQSIFSCFSPDFFEDDELSSEDDVKVGGKRNRSCFENQKVRYELPHNKLKYGLASGETNFLKQVKGHVRSTPTFVVDEYLEFLSQDSGLRGCWFRCKVLEVSKRRIKIVHNDVQDDDSCTNLEEWIPSDRIAKADTLGMRHLRRPTVRPAYPKNDGSLTFKVGDPADAWWCDGWWEGVITSDDKDGNYEVYIPGENLYINAELKNLRISKDWVDDQWLDVEPNPDILLTISGSSQPESKHLTTPAASKETKSGNSSPTFSHKIITVHEPVVGDIHDLEGMTLTNVPLKDECAYNEQQRMLEADEKEYYSEHGNEEETEEENANADLTGATIAHNSDSNDGKADDVGNSSGENKVEEVTVDPTCKVEEVTVDPTCKVEEVTVDPTCEAVMKEAEVAVPMEC